MLFWLTFLQSLPTTSTTDLAALDSLNRDKKTTEEYQEIVAFQSHPPIKATVGQVQVFDAAIVAASVIIAVVVITTLLLWAYKLVYKITPNNEAFVITGGIWKKGSKPVLYGGCVVLPGFHELTRVPLREISIDVERTGKLAVRTKDYLRADMRVTFYVCINPDEQDVKMAASRLSKGNQISENDIKEALEKRADDAIRAAAKRKNLAEIDSDKLGFADEVLNLIQQDLKKVGLTLNNIAISEIEESDSYDEDNFFDAQGVRLRTETIQRSIQQKQEVELTTRVQMEQRDLEAEVESLRIRQEQEEAKLGQNQQVESMKAQREREIQEAKDREAASIERNKILQNKSVEEETIQQKLSVQQNQIEADITLEERNKKLKVAQALQKQESEVAEITRQQTVDASRLRAQIQVAEAERESKVAQQEAAIAIAEREKARFAAEAERAKAESAVVTATEVEKAEREQRLAIITAEQEAQKKRIAEQNVVEIDVFRRRRQAEIARQAAELEAQSIRTLADANKYKALAEAEGQRALIEAQNALSDANRMADLIKALWPELVPQLPEIIKSLAPQPGILGDARIYSFPGANGYSNNGNGNGKGAASTTGDINKLMLSTSGLSLINSLLDDGNLGSLVGQVKELLRSDGKTTVEAAQEKESLATIKEKIESQTPETKPVPVPKPSSPLPPKPEAVPETASEALQEASTERVKRLRKEIKQEKQEGNES